MMWIHECAERGQFALSSSEFSGPGSGDDLLGRDAEPAPDDSAPDDTSHARPGGEEPASGEDDDLDAEEQRGEDYWKQRLAEAEERAGKEARLREKAEKQVDDVTGRILSIEEKRAANEAAAAARTQQPQVPDRPPHSEADLQKILENGTAQDYHRANEANNQWHREKERAQILSQVRQETQAGNLDRVMAERLQVPPGQEKFVRERAQFWLQNGAQNETIAVLLAKADIGTEALKPKKQKSAVEESEERQNRGEPQVRRGRSISAPSGNDFNPDNIPEHIRRHLIRADLGEKYLKKRSNPRDERIRREGLKRVMARYSELNEG
jgi:hypothetical protein